VAIADEERVGRLARLRVAPHPPSIGGVRGSHREKEVGQVDRLAWYGQDDSLASYGELVDSLGWSGFMIRRGTILVA